MNTALAVKYTGKVCDKELMLSTVHVYINKVFSKVEFLNFCGLTLRKILRLSA